MTKEELLKVLEDYSTIASRYANANTVIDFFKKHLIIENEEEDFFHRVSTMHWNSTAYSYFKIPENTSFINVKPDLLAEFESFVEKEGKLLESLRKYHLEILSKIANNELDPWED